MENPTFTNTKQRGVATVEFALIAIVFFTLLFGVIELGRVIYVWNTVQQITRQAAREATVADFTDVGSGGAMDKVRWNAVFRSSAGNLPAAAEINDAAVSINYLNACMKTVDTSTTCPVQNITYCLSNPNGKNCIRFVQVRLCDPDPENTTGCTPILYRPMILQAFVPGFTGIPIPPSQVVMPAESLGYRPSMESCTPIVETPPNDCTP